MIKYLVFDFDGTLADSKAVFINVFNHLAGQYGFKKIHPTNVDYLKSLSLKERFKELDFPFYKLPLIIPKFLSLYNDALKDVTLMEGIKDLLAALDAAGYHLAILSSNNENNIRQFLQNNQISQIQKIHCSNNLFGKDKIINKFLKKNTLKPSEVLYVGDEERDILACKKSGVKIIWVAWGYDSEEIISKNHPDYKVTKPDQILKILQLLNA